MQWRAGWGAAGAPWPLLGWLLGSGAVQRLPSCTALQVLTDPGALRPGAWTPESAS